MRLSTAIVGIIVVLLAWPAAAAELGTLRTDTTFDREAFAHQQRELNDWLLSEHVAKGLTAPLRIELDERELLEVEQGTCEGCTASRALRVGLVKEVAAHIDLAAPAHGSVAKTADGGLVWTVGIESPNARGLRVHLTDFHLPRGAELYLYNQLGEAFGPYVGDGPLGSGEFWTHTVAGPTAMLQLRTFGSAAPAPGAIGFTVADLGHVGRLYTAKYNSPADHPLCSFNADCVENAACYNSSPVSDAKYAIAHMQYVKRPYIYFCSGGLLNNTNGDGTPYFLTANHCISKDREAGTLEAYFQFWTDCNSPECPDYNQVNTPRTLGASLLSTSSTSDYTLLQLGEPAPAGSAFMGWTSTPVAYTVGTDLYRIAHPGGAPQSYSEHTVWNPPVVCSGWERGPWIYSGDVLGATEGGSSGSPVVNGSGQVVGQLSGGCGYNVNDNCDNVQNSTVDGAFAAYYDQVAPWLSPGGCTDADNDGYCDTEDCDDGDPDVNPGAAEVCDGIDNNCDGTVDEGCGGCVDADGDGFEDAACGGSDCDDGDPDVNPFAAEACDGIDNNCDGTVDEGCGTCGAAGDACTSGADCCSGRCHPRQLVCK